MPANSGNTACRMGRLVALLLILVMLFSGCVRVGPNTIPKDRFDYAEAIAESWKDQILLAIVKLRYLEWPQFLEVNQVVAGYNWEMTGNASLLTLGSGTARGGAGWTGRYIERPTITYSPLTGAAFVRGILTPVRPAVLLSLIRSGWPVDRLFETMVQSVNGRPNRSFTTGTMYTADPLFGRFVRAMRQAQLAAAIAINVSETGTAGESMEIGFRYEALAPEDARELKDVLALMGMKPEAERYAVVWEPFHVDPEVLSLQTRSVLQVMVTLASMVEVPDEDLERGSAASTAMDNQDDRSGLPPLMTVKSGPNEPEFAGAKVRYRGHWFWIDDTDINSKRTFAYLSLLLTVTATGSGDAPQLTISTN